MKPQSEWKWYPCLGWSCEGRQQNPKLFLVSTWGHYALGIYTTRELADKCIAEEQAKRKRVPGMAVGEYRITEMELDK